MLTTKNRKEIFAVVKDSSKNLTELKSLTQKSNHMRETNGVNPAVFLEISWKYYYPKVDFFVKLSSYVQYFICLYNKKSRRNFVVVKGSLKNLTELKSLTQKSNQIPESNGTNPAGFEEISNRTKYLKYEKIWRINMKYDAGYPSRNVNINVNINKLMLI